MKWLIYNALSPAVSERLRHAGHDAIHVRDSGLATAEDAEIFDRAAQQDRVLVSADTDFGALFALRSKTMPSIVLFRGATPRRPAEQVALLLANFANIANDLERGAVVVIEPSRVRIRTLPIIRGE
jgi:predicted nuclease of predicted toxin-antitoxin system